MSGKSIVGGRTSGKSSPVGGTATSISDELIEAAAATSPLLPEIRSYTVTASAGTNVSTTLTHNLGVANYLVQIVDPSGDNIVLPFTRTTNTVVFHFGNVDSDTDYTVIIVQ